MQRGTQSSKPRPTVFLTPRPPLLVARVVSGAAMVRCRVCTENDPVVISGREHLATYFNGVEELA